MARPAYIEPDGTGYLWRELLDLRRRQLAEQARAVQPALFALRGDRKPATGATAALRYLEPSLLTLLDGPRP